MSPDENSEEQHRKPCWVAAAAING